MQEDFADFESDATNVNQIPQSPPAQGTPQPVSTDLLDSRIGVEAVGDDSDLRAGERNRLQPFVLDGKRHQRHRFALARGEEHV